MDFGISFWTFGTGNDANLFLTNTFLSPIIINPSSHQDYSLSFANGIDTLLFSGDKINDNLSHHICLNFSPTGLNSYIDSQKCAIDLFAGSNTGNYGFTGIISLFSGFNDYSVNDFIILNRPFEESEISGIYNRDIWDYFNDFQSFIDFSTDPIIDRNSSENWISTKVSNLIYSGREKNKYAFYTFYSSSIYNGSADFFNINLNNDFFIAAWMTYSGGGNYSIFDKHEGSVGYYAGIQSGKLNFIAQSGANKFSIISTESISSLDWDFIGLSCHNKKIDFCYNGNTMNTIYLYNSGEINDVSNHGFFSVGQKNDFFDKINGYVDDIRIF